MTDENRTLGDLCTSGDDAEKMLEFQAYMLDCFQVSSESYHKFVSAASRGAGDLYFYDAGINKSGFRHSGLKGVGSDALDAMLKIHEAEVVKMVWVFMFTFLREFIKNRPTHIPVPPAWMAFNHESNPIRKFFGIKPKHCMGMDIEFGKEKHKWKDSQELPFDEFLGMMYKAEHVNIFGYKQ